MVFCGLVGAISNNPDGKSKEPGGIGLHLPNAFKSGISQADFRATTTGGNPRLPNFMNSIRLLQPVLAMVIRMLLLGLLPSLAWGLTIARPNFGVPEFAQPGGVFHVEVKNAAGLAPNQWSAVLTNDLQSWMATVELVEYGTYVDNNTVAGYRLTVRVPVDTPPETFKLLISHPSGGIAINKNAVGILNSFETDFYFLHYADPQAEGANPTDNVTGMCNSHGSLLEEQWHAPGIRLANPRFMFDTGDELDNKLGSLANYELHKDNMCAMGVPVLATRGNNDSKLSNADWRSTFGVETYSILMGSFYICQKDYNDDVYTTWLQTDYVASFSNPAIKYRLFGQHFNTGTYVWLPPAGEYPNLMLIGHGHSNVNIQSSPYPIIETQQACNKCAVGFFNYTKTGSGWTCSTLGNPWFQMMSSGSTCKLRCQYGSANTGTATTNTAAITNDLAANFHDGRVRFLMQYSAPGYQVSGGQILAQYAYNGGSNMAVLVKVNIPASGSTSLAISQVPANPDANGNGMPDAWETSWFGSTNNPLGAADSDWDHDGQDNLHEYLAGTNPTDPASVLKITSATLNAGGILVLQWPSVAGKTYRIQLATELASGFHDTAAAAIAGTGGTLTQSVSVGTATHGFYRIRIVP